jgi:hypothetical protein
MNSSRILVGFGLTLATSLLSACASSGQGSEQRPETAPTQAGAAAPRRNPFVLTATEIAEAPGVQNAYDAVQQLRPHFLRARGAVATSAGGLLGGGRSRPTSRGNGQGQGSQPSSSGGAPAPESSGPSMPEDVGTLVYVDRQRYGRIHTLRDIPVVSIEEIRFLNVGEATSEFGMGHPHGAIQIITKRGPSEQ